MINKVDDFKHKSMQFGESSPYFVESSGSIFGSFPEAVASMEHRQLDGTAILSQLNFNYILGDRTLVKGLARFPWHSVLTSENELVRGAPYPHGHKFMQEVDIASVFEDKLCEHIGDILKRHEVIWLTLSGGYDSRIIAGVLQKISTKHDIRVLNWGHPDSRDVQYAKEIAEHYGWPFTLIPYDADKNIESIHYSVDHSGAEISPLDYNPIEFNESILREIKPEHAILFAHYGDGIGRAAYANRHIADITELPIRNPYFLFNEYIFSDHATNMRADRALAWSTDQSPPGTVARNELDMHENYMRRMFTKRFEFCHKYDPFCYPPLAEFVYSLDVKCRTDETYRHLLMSLDPYLHDYPWAKTGVSFSGRVDKAGLNPAQHSKQKDYLQFKNLFSNSLLNGQLCSHHIIDRKALSCALKSWPNDLSLTTVLARLYAIELLIEKYDIEVLPQNHSLASSMKNRFGSRAYAVAKQLRSRSSRSSR